MHKKYNLNIIPGDGIGKEVVPVSLQVLEKLSKSNKTTPDHGESLTTTQEGEAIIELL